MLYSTRYYKMAELEKKLKKAIENDKAIFPAGKPVKSLLPHHRVKWGIAIP